jgi:hypothetical protein
MIIIEIMQGLVVVSSLFLLSITAIALFTNMEDYE